jgi:hypothetical protein
MRLHEECMRLRASITVDFEAADYVDAARHQRHFEQFVQEIAERYPDSKLAIRERRKRHSVRFDGLRQGERMLAVAK